MPDHQADTKKVTETIKAISQGLNSDQWGPLEFRNFTQSQFQLLLRSMSGYHHDKWRMDYIADREVLRIKIPTDLHDMMVSDLLLVFRSKIEVHQQASAPADLKSIADRTRLLMGGRVRAGHTVLHTDLQWRLRPDDGPHPRVVIEVGVAESENELDWNAWRFISCTASHIQLVVEIKLKVDEGQAVYTVWQASENTADKIVDSQVIRDGGQSLRIPQSVLCAPPVETVATDASAFIEISGAEIEGCFHEALEEHRRFEES